MIRQENNSKKGIDNAFAGKYTIIVCTQMRFFCYAKIILCHNKRNTSCDGYSRSRRDGKALSIGSMKTRTSSSIAESYFNSSLSESAKGALHRHVWLLSPAQQNRLLPDGRVHRTRKLR